MSALLSVLLASVAGSLHCAGMCGPFAAFYAKGAGRGERAAVHASYHAARLLVYCALGAAAGAAGAALDLAGENLGVRSVAALAAGLALLAWGLVALLRHAGLVLPRLPFPARATAALGRALAALSAQPPARRAFAVGLLTTLLPCGWLHAFVLAAAATGSPSSGATVMAAFWAGTVPVLAAVGGGAAALLGPARRHAPALAAVAVMTLGALALWRNAPDVLRLAAGREAAPCHAPAEAP